MSSNLFNFLNNEESVDYYQNFKAKQEEKLIQIYEEYTCFNKDIARKLIEKSYMQLKINREHSKLLELDYH